MFTPLILNKTIGHRRRRIFKESLGAASFAIIMASCSYYNYDYKNVMDASNLLKRLSHDSNNSWFYKDPRTLMANLDVIYTNIALLSRNTYADENSADLLNQFLEMLSHILVQLQSYPQNRDKVDLVQLCEILRIVVNSTEAKVFFVQINRIVRKIFENYLIKDGVSTPALDLFKDCLERSIEFENFMEVCLLVPAGIQVNLYSEIASAKDWILACLPEFFENVKILPDALIALQCLKKLYEVCHQTQHITNQVLSCIRSLVAFSCNSRLKECSRPILSEMIADFALINNVPWKQNYPNLTALVYSLPSALQNWPKAGNDTFFVIALMLEYHQNSRVLPWSSDQIMLAIVKRAKKQETIVPPVFKAMCFLFPYYVMKCIKSPVLVETSFRLINRLEHCGAFYDVITPHENQLAWILKSSNASISTKFALLEMWLNEDNKIEVLCNVLESYGLEDILLEYIHKYPENTISKKAAIAASKIQSATLPKKITSSLFQNLSCMDLCGKLLLSKPAIPTDTNQTLNLCAAMGAIIPYLHDKDVFVASCLFSRKLLYYLKNQPNAMLQFCKNMSNMKVIFGAAVNADDDIGICVLELLKMLLRFQILHNLNFTNGFETNFIHLIRGSMQRKNIALQLVMLVTKYRNTKDLYLDYPQDTCLSIYQKLHEFSGTELAEISYSCMLIMLAQNSDFLTFSSVTYALMVMQYNYPQNCATNGSFLKFAKHWFHYARLANIFDLPQGMEECILLRMNHGVM